MTIAIFFDKLDGIYMPIHGKCVREAAVSFPFSSFPFLCIAEWHLAPLPEKSSFKKRCFEHWSKHIFNFEVQTITRWFLFIAIIWYKTCGFIDCFFPMHTTIENYFNCGFQPSKPWQQIKNSFHEYFRIEIYVNPLFVTTQEKKKNGIKSIDNSKKHTTRKGMKKTYEIRHTKNHHLNIVSKCVEQKLVCVSSDWSFFFFYFYFFWSCFSSSLLPLVDVFVKRGILVKNYVVCNVTH